MMRKILALYRKEMGQYFVAPTSYVAFAFFFVVMGYLFSTAFIGSQIVREEYVYQSASFLFLFITPLLSMRLVSEELRQGTDELLFTSPLTVFHIVIGKYLAAVTVVLMILTISLIYPWILTRYGELDWGLLAAAYLGLFLIASAMMAVGLFASSLSAHQMVSGIVAFVLLLGFWILETASDAFYGLSQEVLSSFSMLHHLEDFEKGIVDVSHIAYYLALILLFLGLAVQSLEKRRWR